MSGAGENRFLIRFLSVVAGLLLLRQLWWVFFGFLNVDEFENLQILWLLEHGVLPYRDYVNPHLPVYNFLLYPLYLLFGPTASLPGLVRIVFLPLMALSIAMVYRLGYRLAGGITGGLLSVILYLMVPTVAKSLAEMRPDSLAMPLVLGASLLLLRYLDCDKVRHFYLAGLLLGLSLLFNQKAVLLILFIALAAERHHTRNAASFAVRLGKQALFFTLVALPFLLTVAVLFALGWLNTDAVRMFANGGLDWAGSPLVGQYRKFRLIVLGLSCLPIIVSAVLAMVKSRRNTRSGLGMALASGFALASLVQIPAMIIFFDHLILLPGVFIAVCAAWWLARHRVWVAVSFLIVAILVANLIDLVPFSSRSEQVRAFDYILAEVPAERPVLDVSTGLSAFHPIVGRHLFFRAMLFNVDLYHEQTIAVSKALGEKRFGAVIMDPLLAKSPPGIISLIERSYSPVAFDYIWLPSR